MFFFQDVSLIISSIGVTSFTLFHIFFKLNVSHDNKANGHSANSGTALVKEDGEASVHAKSKIMHFLQKPLLYQASLL
jgi:hypothetical protein